MTRALLTACLLTGLTGCLGGVGNPSYFPWLLPGGDIIRTHAKPPGKGYFADFDPHAFRLVVRPEVAVRGVGTEQVFIATVYDRDGVPRRSRRVEWLLEGTGHIIEVDESGYLPGRGYKVDNRYAVSYTDYKEHLITRGNQDPTDDFMIRPGQTWCVVSSAVEGRSALTVYVPAISDWDYNRVVVQTDWLDARCEFPAGAVLPAGREYVFSPRVYRNSDDRPLPGYRVRYRVLDGPPAVLRAAGYEADSGTGSQRPTTEMELASDSTGRAEVTLVPLTTKPGTARVAVEVIRPDDLDPTAEGTVIARTESEIQWQAAEVTLKLRAPPSSSVLDDIPVTLSIANRGQVASEPVSARLAIPGSLEVVRLQPRCQFDGREVVWSLDPLASGEQHLLQVDLRPREPGRMQLQASASTADGQAGRDEVITEVTAGRLEVTHSVPGGAVVGEELPVQVRVRNAGTGEVTGIRVQVGYDAGLSHPSNRNPVEEVLESLEPGEATTLTIPLTIRQPGRWSIRTTAMAEGDVFGEAPPVSVEAGDPQLVLEVSGTERAYLGQNVNWSLRVRNAGDVPLSNATLQASFPLEVEFRTASDGGQFVTDRVQWTLGTLAVGDSREVSVSGLAVQLAQAATLSADVSGDPLVQGDDGVRVATVDRVQGLDQQASAAVEILGIPALEVKLFDLADPVSVGGKTTYQITVSNNGSLRADEVAITATIPAELTIVRVNAPAQPEFEGQLIKFAPTTIAPGERVQLAVEVEVMAAGDARFGVEAMSRSLPQPVRAEEATRLLPPAR